MYVLSNHYLHTQWACIGTGWNATSHFLELLPTRQLGIDGLRFEGRFAKFENQKSTQSFIAALAEL